MPVAEGQDQDLAGPDPPSLEQLRGQHHSPPGWLPVCRKTPQGLPRPPGRWKHGAIRASSGTWTCPPWSHEGGLPPSSTSGLSQHQPHPLCCSCVEALGLPRVQATTTPHPREGRGVTPPWGSHSCSLPLCGSGGWVLVTEQSWGHQTPRPCVSLVVLGYLMAHADTALRWGKVQRCVWFLGNRRS